MRFKESTFEENKAYYRTYYYSLVGGFDDFIEDHIIEGKHINILLDEKVVGVFALNKENKLMCIVLDGTYSHLYEKVFDQVLLYGHVQGVFTITNDPLMMASIIRRNINIHKQAYNFILNKTPNEPKQLLDYKLATPDDALVLKETFGDFLDDYAKYAELGRIYLGYLGETVVSLGHIKEHTFTKDTVSIGMMVRESMRNKGYARDTIAFLIREGIKRNKVVQAGCWYYNHASKKTLMGAGLEVVSLIVFSDEL